MAGCISSLAEGRVWICDKPSRFYFRLRSLTEEKDKRVSEEQKIRKLMIVFM